MHVPEDIQSCLITFLPESEFLIDEYLEKFHAKCYRTETGEFTTIPMNVSRESKWIMVYMDFNSAGLSGGVGATMKMYMRVAFIPRRDNEINIIKGDKQMYIKYLSESDPQLALDISYAHSCFLVKGIHTQKNGLKRFPQTAIFEGLNPIEIKDL